jgi:hypothetical protein
VPLLERLPSLVDLVLVEAVLLDGGADLVLLDKVESVREALVGDDGRALNAESFLLMCREGEEKKSARKREDREEGEANGEDVAVRRPERVSRGTRRMRSGEKERTRGGG